jgi:hypothetical protein
MNMNNKNLSVKEKEIMKGPLREEKKNLIDFAERKLNDLKLDLALIENMRSMVDTIIDRY